MKYGTFQNGDFWKGEKETEDGRDWFFAYESMATEDPDYSTLEVPVVNSALFPTQTITFAQEYELAKRIGDKRFGSECTHEHVNSGHCTNCLRKVVTA